MKPKTRVLATGVFDLLHPGHVHYLEESKKLGDELVVIVANDAYVTKTKGAPVFNASSRKHLVEALACVDQAIVPEHTNFDEFYHTVLELNPDIITLGFNQRYDEKELTKIYRTHGWQGKVVRISPYPGEEISSTKLKNKIRQHPK